MRAKALTTQPQPAPEPAARAARLPVEWRPSAADVAFAEQYGFSPDEVESLAGFFNDYWQAESGTRARKCSWAATWRVWIRREVQFRSRRRGGQQGSGLRDGMANALAYGRQP